MHVFFSTAQFFFYFVLHADMLLSLPNRVKELKSGDRNLSALELPLAAFFKLFAIIESKVLPSTLHHLSPCSSLVVTTVLCTRDVRRTYLVSRDSLSLPQSLSSLISSIPESAVTPGIIEVIKEQILVLMVFIKVINNSFFFVYLYSKPHPGFFSLLTWVFVLNMIELIK